MSWNVIPDARFGKRWVAAGEGDILARIDTALAQPSGSSRTGGRASRMTRAS